MCVCVCDGVSVSTEVLSRIKAEYCWHYDGVPVETLVFFSKLVTPLISTYLGLGWISVAVCVCVCVCE